MSRKLFLICVFVFAATGVTPAQSPTTKPASTKSTAPAQQHKDEGQRIFEQNCSRCHTTPDGFSSHISGTIVMHMRVRASLSEHDAETLLRFFNP